MFNLQKLFTVFSLFIAFGFTSSASAMACIDFFSEPKGAFVLQKEITIAVAGIQSDMKSLAKSGNEYSMIVKESAQQGEAAFRAGRDFGGLGFWKDAIRIVNEVSGMISRSMQNSTKNTLRLIEYLERVRRFKV